MPCSAPDASGTPITGSIVCAATAPARWLAMPAHAMNTSTPRAGARSTYAETRSGVRCADKHLELARDAELLEHLLRLAHLLEVVGAAGQDRDLDRDRG